MSPKPRAQERKAGTSILHQDLDHDGGILGNLVQCLSAVHWLAAIHIMIFSSRNLPSVGNLGNGNMQRIHKGSCILRQIPLGTCQNIQEPVITVREEETSRVRPFRTLQG
jgi:hypothetical protein